MSRDDDWGGSRPRGGRRDDVWSTAGEDREDDAPAPARPTTPEDPPPPSAAADRSAEPPAPETRAARRSADDHGRHRRGIVAALVAVALLLGLGAWALLRDGGDEDVACGEDAVNVLVAPELAETVESALARVTAKDECATFRVEAMGASDVASSINDGQAPDVWIPDSSTWVDAVDPAKTSGQWREGTSVAVSPVALAVGSERPRGERSLDSWSSLLNKGGDLSVANPDVDTASRLAYHASRIGQPDRMGLQTGARLIVLSRFAAASVNRIYDTYEGDPKATMPFPASEQSIAAWNAAHPDAPQLRAVLPTKGTLSLDYPWITNPELSGEALKHAEQARATFGTIEMRKDLAKAGFRSIDGDGGPKTGGQRAGELVELTPLSRDERLASVEQWDVLRTDMRMLPIIDVSGSMAYASPTPGVTRFEVAQGALLKGLGIIPAGSQIGGWIFSSDKGGKGIDHKELSPVRRLDARAPGGKTQRELLKGLIERSDKYLGGDTGLYDSIWAGYQKMSKEFDPKYVNSIVIVTDGENDDPNGGLSLKQLVAKIDDAYDPEKPVRIITIGMGEANPEALREIADASGGSSHIAETPGDIQRVFVESLLARRTS